MELQVKPIKFFLFRCYFKMKKKKTKLTLLFVGLHDWYRSLGLCSYPQTPILYFILFSSSSFYGNTNGKKSLLILPKRNKFANFVTLKKQRTFQFFVHENRKRECNNMLQNAKLNILNDVNAKLYRWEKSLSVYCIT